VGEVDLGVGGTRNFAAYDAYLVGLSLYNQLGQENYARAIEHLEKAVALDPDSAQARSVLTIVYFEAATVWISERADDLIKKSEAAASRAIAIAPEAASSLRAAGLQQMQRRDWTAAEQSWKKALELAPAEALTNVGYGRFLLYAGRAREAIEYFRRAVRSDRLALGPTQWLGFAHELNGDIDAASKEFERGKGLPGNQVLSNIAILVVAMEMGDRALMEPYLEKIGDNDLLPPDNLSLTEKMRPLLDSPEAARMDLRRFYRDPAYSNLIALSAIAIWASYFSDHELALKAYHELSETRALTVFAIWRPVHKQMRQLPGFKDLVQTLGLVDYWRTTGNWNDFCRPLGEDDFECE
jgi:Tfp pilus assembly protein PilF